MNLRNINPLFIYAVFAVTAGGISGILFATGFGAIALSIFISLLISGLLLLGNEYYSLKNKAREDKEELEVEIESLRVDLMGLAEVMQQKFIGISEGFGQDLVSIQESHHEDIQGVYLVISNIMGEEDD